MRRRLLFILSDRTSRPKPGLVKQLDRFCRRNGRFEATIAITRYRSHLRELTLDFASREPEGIVIVAGGDGSLNEAANALAELRTGTALSAMPYGTANDFCRQIYGQHFNIKSYLKALDDLEIRPIDLVRLAGDMTLLGNGPESLGDVRQTQTVYSLNVASLGIDSDICRTAYRYLQRYPKLKARAYDLATLRHLLCFRAQNMRFSIDGESREQANLLFAVCNAGYYGGGFNPAPEASLEDGLMNYCIGPKVGLLRFAKLAKKYKNGGINDEPGILSGTCRACVVESTNGQQLLGNFDGTLFMAERMDFSIEEKVLPYAFVGPLLSRKEKKLIARASKAEAKAERAREQLANSQLPLSAIKGPGQTDLPEHEP